MIKPRDELGTAMTDSAVRIMLLGSGELGKEIAIEAQRLGVEVVAVDRYANAPAMQVAHRSYVGGHEERRLPVLGGRARKARRDNPPR